MIIGISGLGGVGKSTSAEFLTQKFRMVEISFADPLKRIVRDVFDFSEDQLWGPSASRNKPDSRYLREDGSYLSPRLALQVLGTEFGRHCYPNVWIEYALRIANTMLDNPTEWSYTKTLGIYRNDNVSEPIQGVVISDMRFKNEIDIMKGHGAILLRITRPGAGLEGAAGQHPSEKEQASIPDDVFDYVVHNDGTIADLHSKLNDIFNEVVVQNVMGKDQVVS